MGKIIVQIDDMPEIEVPKRTYCEAKAKQLIEFGYSDITADDVEKQVDLLLSGGEWTDVIGAFVKRDLVLKK